MTHWYRVQETTYSAGVDEFGDPLPGGPTRPNLSMFRVLKETPCGVWIDGYCGRQFINRSWNKKYASPTVEEAIESFKARKNAQIRIANHRIKQCKEAMDYLDNYGFYYDDRKWNKEL